MRFPALLILLPMLVAADSTPAESWTVKMNEWASGSELLVCRRTAEHALECGDFQAVQVEIKKQEMIKEEIENRKAELRERWCRGWLECHPGEFQL